MMKIVITCSCHVQASCCLSLAFPTLIWTIGIHIVSSGVRDLLVYHCSNYTTTHISTNNMSFLCFYSVFYSWLIFVHLHYGLFFIFYYFETKSRPIYSASFSPALYHQVGGSQCGPARLGMKRRVHNLCAGMLIFKSKGQLPFHHGGGCGIFSALQMFMNNVCGQTPGCGWGRRDWGARRREEARGEAVKPDELHVGGIWQAAWSFVIIPKF